MLYFAEFSPQIINSGSKHLHSFVIVDKLGAFITAWILILNNITGVAIRIWAWTLALDNLFGNKISQTLQETISRHVPRVFVEVLGFFFMFLVLLLMGLLTRNIRQVSLVTKVVTLVNLLVLGFVIIYGFLKGDLHNWKLTEDNYIMAWTQPKGINPPEPRGPKLEVDSVTLLAWDLWALEDLCLLASRGYSMDQLPVSILLQA
ncbi:Cationic amino acid transporter 3 [Vulpes lagopus]